jgi:hypothetical protein
MPILCDFLTNFMQPLAAEASTTGDQQFTVAPSPNEATCSDTVQANRKKSHA